jgi:hypothetical protein
MAGEGGGHGTTLAMWIVVGVMIAGSIMMGVSLIEWYWVTFWIGTGLFVGGGIGGYFAGIMNAVTEYSAVPPLQEVEAA